MLRLPTLNRRIILYGALAVTAVLYVGDVGYRRLYEEPVRSAEEQAAALRERLRKQRLAIAKAKQAVQSLDQFQQRALPRNLELARSGYQSWLLEVVKKCNLAAAKVDSGDPQTRSLQGQSLYHAIPFSLRGRGNLRQITSLLHDFYSAGHLHKMRTLTLTPVGVSDQLDVAISVEALALDSADRDAELTSLTSNRLASNELADYRAIAARNLFQSGGDRIGRQIRLSAITLNVRGQHEAWFSYERDDQTRRLREGESLEVGALIAQVVTINQKSATLVIDDQTWLVPIGAEPGGGQDQARSVARRRITSSSIAPRSNAKGQVRGIPFSPPYAWKACVVRDSAYRGYHCMRARKSN